MSRVPLAWKNLVHDRRKLLVAVGGIGFAVLLMFQQRGFNHALFDSTVALLRALSADIVVVNRARFTLSSELRFDRSVMDLLQSNSDVRSTDRVYLENTVARLRRSGNRARPIRVIGLNAADPPLVDEGTRRKLQNLFGSPMTALIDVRSKKDFGFSLSRPVDLTETGELAGRTLNVVGTFSMGRDFAHEGNLLMADEELAKYFPYRGHSPLETIDIGLVNLREGVNPEEAVKRLQESAGPGVSITTREQLIRKEIGFWARSTPIGTIFAIGAIMGFVVGIVICYQVLATDIADHMGEFATLRAMGYRDSYFYRLIFSQSLILSVLGFVPGMLASWVLFRFTSIQTGLLMAMTWDRALTILVLTIGMCLLSGVLAIRKLLSADPAGLF